MLYAKTLGIAEPRVILAKALQPPNLVDIEQTIIILKEVREGRREEERERREREGRELEGSGEIFLCSVCMTSLPLVSLGVKLKPYIYIPHIM